MRPTQTRVRPMNVIGIQTRTTNAQENEGGGGKIPALWERFFSERIAEKLADGNNAGEVYGVYTDYESDHTGEYTLLVGVEVNNIQKLPEGMHGVTIPQGKYLVFTCRGEMPQAVIEGWKRAWQFFAENIQYRRAFTTDFEHYVENQVDLYIAIE